MSEGTLTLLMSLVALAILLGFAMLVSSYKCDARWSGTYPSDWAPFQGCRVEVGGKWIPEDRVREVQP